MNGDSPTATSPYRPNSGPPIGPVERCRTCRQSGRVFGQIDRRRRRPAMRLGQVGEDRFEVGPGAGAGDARPTARRTRPARSVRRSGAAARRPARPRGRRCRCGSSSAMAPSCATRREPDSANCHRPARSSLSPRCVLAGQPGVQVLGLDLVGVDPLFQVGGHLVPLFAQQDERQRHRQHDGDQGGQQRTAPGPPRAGTHSTPNRPNRSTVYSHIAPSVCPADGLRGVGQSRLRPRPPAARPAARPASPVPRTPG